MSNLGFESGWVSSTTRNLTSWAKPTLHEEINFDVGMVGGYPWN
jgi:hypothetical protein